MQGKLRRLVELHSLALHAVLHALSSTRESGLRAACISKIVGLTKKVQWAVMPQPQPTAAGSADMHQTTQLAAIRAPPMERLHCMHSSNVLSPTY